MRGRAWSCAVGRARSCVVMRGRACVVGHSWSCAVGRAWSCAVGRARSCVVVPFCPLCGQHCRAARFAASTAVTRTNEGTKERRNEGTKERRNEGTKERTTSNNPLNPSGVGWVNFFYPIKVRVSMGTCVPNLGAIRRPVRKMCLSNL